MQGAVKGMIAVDKMGARVLFLDPRSYETQVALEGFQRTVHELLVMPPPRGRCSRIDCDRNLSSRSSWPSRPTWAAV